MGLEELIDQLRGLPPEDLDEVVDFVAYLRRRGAMAGQGPDVEGEGLLDRVAGDPALKARFDAMLDDVTASLDRGEGIDGATFFAKMREKSRERRG